MFGRNLEIGVRIGLEPGRIPHMGTGRVCNCGALFEDQNRPTMLGEPACHSRTKRATANDKHICVVCRRVLIVDIAQTVMLRFELINPADFSSMIVPRYSGR